MKGRSRHKAKKSLGQNFLVSESVARKVVEALSPLPGDLVFEIGPGQGALTVPIAETGTGITAYEIDASLAGELEERCRDLENVEIVVADIRDMDLEEAASERGARRYKIVGNIPYHLTSTVLLDLPRWRGCGIAVIMVQREVGERILASPGERNCGILSVFLQSYFDITKVTRVRAGSFFPRPKVESVVLRFVPAGRGPEDREGFLAFLKACFSQRRKKLKTVLRGSMGMSDAGKLSRLGDLAGTDLGRRPEEVGLEGWFDLFGAFNRIKGQ